MDVINGALSVPAMTPTICSALMDCSQASDHGSTSTGYSLSAVIFCSQSTALLTPSSVVTVTDVWVLESAYGLPPACHAMDSTREESEGRAASQWPFSLTVLATS